MIHRVLFILMIVLIGLPFFAATAYGQEKFHSKAATIRGFVAVVEEDENGEPLLVAIVTDDGYDLQYYYVVKEGKGKEMFGEIGSTVVVTGLIERHYDGRKWIRIQHWELKSVKPDNAIMRQMQNPYNEADIQQPLAPRATDTSTSPAAGQRK